MKQAFIKKTKQATQTCTMQKRQKTTSFTPNFTTLKKKSAPI